MSRSVRHDPDACLALPLPDPDVLDRGPVPRGRLHSRLGAGRLPGVRRGWFIWSLVRNIKGLLLLNENRPIRRSRLVAVRLRSPARFDGPRPRHYRSRMDFDLSEEQRAIQDTAREFRARRNDAACEGLGRELHLPGRDVAQGGGARLRRHLRQGGRRRLGADAARLRRSSSRSWRRAAPRPPPTSRSTTWPPG